MIDIPDLMKTLALQRGAYHSEADFQHAVAWEIHRRLPMASVRLERPTKANGKTLHLDLLVQFSGKALAIELKYKTRKLAVGVDGEEFELANHSAADIGRYDFIKDISRLESISATLKDCDGWAIILTNDSSYWKEPNNKATVDAAFRVNENRFLHGTLGWAENASDGTKRNREADLQINGKYVLQWQDYSSLSRESNGDFKFLAVHVPQNTE
jgi:hypothetical protein